MSPDSTCMTFSRVRPSRRSVRTMCSSNASTSSKRVSSRWGTMSVQYCRSGSTAGAATSLKLRALPFAFVTMRKRSPRSSFQWCSTAYSWPASRGAITRGASSGASVGMKRTSEVVFDELSIRMNRPLRVRDTPTKNRSSSSWNTRTSSPAPVPTVCCQTCHGRIASSGRT